MYRVNLANPDEFLNKYWQKQPVVIRKAFDSFVDPLDEHELAGLAQEDIVDSRIISRQKDQWSVEQGPIEDFEQHCVGAWSLLVQGVDQYSADANSLLNAFNFIPKWRIEDLMVSYSHTDAGVGPHLDQYDVFIVQGKGSRRWQVGKKEQPENRYKTQIPHPKLRQIELFSPIIDEVLHPGDMIYIPPGFPHNGVALEPCMNYSIGFRAPTQKDLVTALADYAEQHNRLTERFTDPDRNMISNNYFLHANDIDKFRTLITKFADSAEFEHFLGQFLTTTDNFDGEDTTHQNDDLTASELEEFLNNGGCLVKCLDAKCLLMESKHGNWTLFINQTSLPIQNEQVECINEVLNIDSINAEYVSQIIETHLITKYDLSTLLVKLVSNKAWYFE